MEVTNWPEYPTEWRGEVGFPDGYPLRCEASALSAAERAKKVVLRFKKSLSHARSYQRTFALDYFRKDATQKIKRAVDYMEKDLPRNVVHRYRAVAREYMYAMQRAIEDVMSVPEPEPMGVLIEKINWSNKNGRGVRKALSFVADPPETDIDLLQHDTKNDMIRILSDDNLHRVRVEIEGIDGVRRLRQRLSGRGNRYEWWPTYGWE